MFASALLVFLKNNHLLIDIQQKDEQETLQREREI